MSGTTVPRYSDACFCMWSVVLEASTIFCFPFFTRRRSGCSTSWIRTTRVCRESVMTPGDGQWCFAGTTAKSDDQRFNSYPRRTRSRRWFPVRGTWVMDGDPTREMWKKTGSTISRTMEKQDDYSLVPFFLFLSIVVSGTFVSRATGSISASAILLFWMYGM